MFKVIKYLIGIILVQVLTIVLVRLSPGELEGANLLRLAIPLGFISLAVAFWFASLAEHHRKDDIAKIQGEFAKEREKLRVNAERAKTRVVKKAQQDIAKEAKTTHAKANFKVGAAVAGAMGVGALFIFAQMLTVGLLTLTTAGGAMGGYYLRGRRAEQKGLRADDVASSDVKVIEAEPRFKLPFKKKEESNE